MQMRESCHAVGSRKVNNVSESFKFYLLLGEASYQVDRILGSTLNTQYSK
jgi:hypothetical protein